MHSNNIKSMRSFVRNSNKFSGRSKRLTSQILPCYFEKKGGGKMDDVKKKMNPIEYDWTTMGDGRKHRDPVEEMHPGPLVWYRTTAAEESLRKLSAWEFYPTIRYEI